jgi:alpha-1,6-mannosyltransferase
VDDLRHSSPQQWNFAGAMSLAAAVMLLFWGQRYGNYPIALWLTLMTIAALMLAWCAMWCVKRAATPTTIQVIGWALALRVVTMWSTPYFEDDYFRYLWDGYRTLQDGNPYQFAPSHFFSADGAALPSKIADALSALNNPDINTIYGPALQWLFALAAAIAPGELWPIRVLWLAVDMTLVCVLVKHVGTTRAMLYSMCPLVLHEIGVAMHPDGLIGALIFFAFVAIKKERAILAAVFIGCASAMKIHALLALPFLLIGLSGISFATVARALVVVAATYVFFWLPFLFADGAFAQAWKSFATFARDWQFNALGFAFVQMFVGTAAARIACALLLLMSWALIARWVWKKQASNASALVMAFGMLLFFSPVINPWYLLWLLPLATMTDQRALWITPWVASIILPLSYASDFNMGISSVPYTLPVWITLAESLLILAAISFDLQRKMKLTMFHQEAT